MATLEHAAAPSTELRSESGLGPFPIWWALATTLTLYGAVWAYRQGKDLRSLGRSRTAPPAWVVGFLFFATQPFVLRRLAQEARRRSQALGLEPRVSPWGVFALAAVLAAADLLPFVYPGAGVLTFVLLPLFPMPVVLVQREICRARHVEGRPEARMSWPLRAASLAGSGAIAAGVWFAHSSGGIDRLLGRALRPAQVVSSRSGRWAVTVAGRGWVRVPSGRVGEADSDLELIGRDGESWLIGYVSASAPHRLDEVVATRAQLVAGATSLAEVRERRFFYPGLDLAPASLARYAGAGWSKSSFHVLTVADGEQVIEVVGYASRPGLEGELREMVEGIRIVPAATP